MPGMPFTNGLMCKVGNQGMKSATVIDRVYAKERGGGMIVLCVTNTSEACMWMESYNEVYGRTNNPYDLARTVGTLLVTIFTMHS